MVNITKKIKWWLPPLLKRKEKDRESWNEERRFIRSDQIRSVAQSCPTLCWLHESQHARLPCPSPTPRVHSNSRPLSQWCHAAIPSSVIPFSSCPQSLPASESFPMSQLFACTLPTLGNRDLGSLRGVLMLCSKAPAWESMLLGFPRLGRGLIAVALGSFKEEDPYPS